MIVSTVVTRSLLTGVAVTWSVLVMATVSSGPYGSVQGQYKEKPRSTCRCAPVPIPGQGSEQDLHPEVVLLGFVVVHAHLQHPPGLHLLHVRHVAGVRVEAALP